MRQFKVFKYRGLWYADEGRWFTPRTFETWSEAMVYADFLSRTIEVTLPRNHLPLVLCGEEGDTNLTVKCNPKENNVTITDDFQGDVIVLRRFELKPLALALLAEDHRTEEEE